MEKEEIKIEQLELQAECELCNHDCYPTDAYCPNCGLSLVCIRDGLYYCARCEKDFKIVEIKNDKNN